MKKTTQLILSALIISATSFTTVSAQSNLGADCGCPPVSSRPTKNVTIISDANGNLTSNYYMSCDTTYILNEKLWVSNGVTLTIAPGTVIKGALTGLNVPQNSLIITRGGKLIADGTPNCPIVFTSINDPMNGTYPVGTRADWGGIQILGKAQLARVGGTFGTVTTSNGEWVMEGLNNDPRSVFGGGASPINNDNSGTIRYVSIRHAGGAVAANVELNGLSLGAVGSGTIIENLEIVSNDDDGVELWGGAVNAKYWSNLFVNDDGFDIDADYDGKMQFLFGLKAPSSIASGGESGFEWDGDEGTSTWFGGYNSAVSTWRSHPVVYNATIIGNNSTTGATGTGTTTGNPFGVSFKSKAEGEIYNSIFTGFNAAFNLQASTDSSKLLYDQNLVKIGCNHIIPNTKGISAAAANATFTGADSVRFFGTDQNESVTSIVGFDASFNINGTTNQVTDNIDLTPTSNITTTCTPPADGFFVPANYRGAFEAGKKGWLNKWAYTSIVNVVPGLAPCPTDLNSDGITNTSDFLLFVAQFNLSCN